MYNPKRIKSYFLLLSAFCFLVLHSSCQKGEQEPTLPLAHLGRDAQAKVAAPRTFILVPGAWHPASCWGEVASNLTKAGHKVKTVELPGLGNDLTPVETVSLASHVEAVEKVIAATPGKLVLVGHSYGGILLSQVGERMPQKIEKLVYLAAFMVENGESLFDIATKDTASLVVGNLYIEGPLAKIPQTMYKPAFYNTSLTNPSPLLTLKVDALCKKLRPHPAATLVTPVSLTARYEALHKIYIATTNDRAITYATQKKMVQNHPGTLTYTLKSDHSPFVTNPEELSWLLLGLFR